MTDDRILFDTNHNDETIPLSDISTFSFEDIRRRERISLSGPNDDENIYGGVTDEDDIVLENFGHILLDSTTGIEAESSAAEDDAGFKLLQETSQRNYFTTEASGNLIVESYSTNSNLSRMIIDGTNNDNIILEEFTFDIIPQLKLEGNENGEGLILLDGTDSSGSDSGDNIEIEGFTIVDGISNPIGLVYEDHNIFTSIGEIPSSNYSLNSSNVITKGHVRSAEILVRDTGDVSLEDATDSTHGFLVDETNGDNIDLEGATGITY